MRSAPKIGRVNPLNKSLRDRVEIRFWPQMKTDIKDLGAFFREFLIKNQCSSVFIWVDFDLASRRRIRVSWNLSHFSPERDYLGRDESQNQREKQAVQEYDLLNEKPRN